MSAAGIAREGQGETVKHRTTMSVALLSLVRASPGHAQAPAPGIVPPAEVTTIVRSNGLHPLGPPVRQRSIYVLRATSARGVQMSVVVDAYDGRILAVNPVAPRPYGGRVGMYGPPPYGSGPRGYPPGPYAAAMPPPYRVPRAAGAAPGGYEDAALPPAAHPRSVAAASPPLPRPRPAHLAADNPPGEAGPAATAAPQGGTDIRSPAHDPAAPLND